MAKPNDQTRFSLEEPLFEQMGQIPADPEPELEAKPVVPWYKRKKILMLIIIGVTFFILLILFVVAQLIRQGRLQTLVEPEESTEITQEQLSDPLLVRILAAEEELKAADPTKRELGYPTMDYQITLDQIRR